MTGSRTDPKTGGARAATCGRARSVVRERVRRRTRQRRRTSEGFPGATTSATVSRMCFVVSNAWGCSDRRNLPVARTEFSAMKTWDC